MVGAKKQLAPVFKGSPFIAMDLEPESLHSFIQIKTEDNHCVSDEEEGESVDVTIGIVDEYGEQLEDNIVNGEEDVKVEIKEEDDLSWREDTEVTRFKTMETYSKEKQIKDEESAVASALPMTSQMFVLTEDGLESVENYLDDDTTQHKQHQDTAIIVSVQMESSDSGPSMNGDMSSNESLSTYYNTRVGSPQPHSSTISQNTRKRKVATSDKAKDFAAERNSIRQKQIWIRRRHTYAI